MGSRGDCYDNAVAESFFATLKKELLPGRSWPSKAELRTEVFEYIEVFFNRRRRHSTLGYRTPLKFENRTLGQSRAGVAAWRLASTTKIKLPATPSATA
jgi:transposase InsO family protein